MTNQEGRALPAPSTDSDKILIAILEELRLIREALGKRK